MLTGSVSRTLLGLALPVLAEQFLNFLVGFTDTFLAGKLPEEVSVYATGAVGVAAYVGWLASMIFMLVGVGTSALVARAIGAGDRSQADRLTSRSIAIAGLLGVLFWLAMRPGAPFLARQLCDSPQQMEIVTDYIRTDSVGHIFGAISLVGAAALRGAGNMAAPMAVLGTVSLLNMVLSYGFVFGVGPFPSLGIRGIVMGTVISRIAGGCLLLTLLASGKTRLKIDWSQVRIGGPDTRRLLEIGLPAGVDGLLMWIGHFVFLKIISRLGETALAAHMIGVQMESLNTLPAVAWGAASATLIGQSLGGRLPDRALKAGHAAARQCLYYSLIMMAVFFGLAEPIFHLMHKSTEVHAVGIPAFRWLALFQIPLVINIVYVHSLRGAGDTTFPMLMSIAGVFFIRVPLAWLCGVVLNGGLSGAWIGMYADVLWRCLAGTWRFTSGKWIDVEPAEDHASESA